MHYKLGLLGRKLGYSLSPKIHAAFLEAASLSGTYQKLEVEPESVADPDFVRDLERDGFDGLNITIPYKSALLDRLTKIAAPATRCSAVNTICRGSRPDNWSGLNTDIGGAIDALGLLPLTEDHTFVLIGAGGAARAALIAIEATYQRLGKSLACDCVVLVRDVMGERAQIMREFIAASRLAMPVRLVSYDDGPDICKQKNPDSGRLLINATPIGQSPNSSQQIPDWCQAMLGALRKGDCLMDMVYAKGGLTPILETLRDIELSRQTGHIAAIDGLPMLIAQAAMAFETWTGRQADRLAAKKAIENDFKNSLGV